jgi:tetratricopeptide (TPR) repeat protein
LTLGCFGAGLVLSRQFLSRGASPAESKPIATKPAPNAAVPVAASPASAPASGSAAAPKVVKRSEPTPPASGKEHAPAPQRGGIQLGFLGSEVDGLAAFARTMATKGGADEAAFKSAVDAVKSSRDNVQAWAKLGGLVHGLRDKDVALRLFDRTLELIESQAALKPPADGQEGTRVVAIADALVASNDAEGARVLLLRSIQRDENSQTGGQPLPALLRVIELEKSAGVSDTGSKARVLKAIDLALRADRSQAAVDLLTRAGDEARKEQDFVSAEAHYQQAMEISHAAGFAERLAEQYGNLAETYLARGQTSEAVSYWRSARDQFAQLGRTQKADSINTILKKYAPTATRSQSEPSYRDSGTFSSVIKQ